MKFLAAFVAAAAIAPIAFAKPMTNSWDILNKRSSDVCKDVQLVVSILKLNKATPFCSTFLCIKTKTVPTTKVSTVFTTTTVTSDLYLSTTETAKTEVLTFTNTVTDATVPTTIATEVIPSVTVVTVTVTPAPSIVYTTTYTTPVGVKARSAAIEERGVNVALPPFVTKYASSAISKACSCLSLTTPTVTSTVQVSQTSTVTSIVTQTHINTIPVTLTLSTTEIVKATSYDTKTITTTSVSTSTSTVNLPQQTTTQTVSIPFSPYCVNILKDKKLHRYQDIITSRTYYGLGTPAMPRGETGLSLCCQTCYNTPGCSLWNYFNLSAGANCELVGAYNYVDTKVSPQCPRGIDGSSVIGTGTDTVNDDSGYATSGIGPCFKGDF